MADPSTPSQTGIDPRAAQHLMARLARAVAAPWLHQEVGRRMAERLQVLRQPPAAWLSWGDHLGGAREAVQAVWPQARCSVVEPTAALHARSLEAARGPWWRGGRPRWPVLTEAEVAPASAGMLWSNMQLHLAPDLPALLASWLRALQPEGVLMFSTYGPDTLRELHALYAEAGWPAPQHPFVDMHDLGDALVHAGFADPVMDQETLRLSWSSPAALLDELRSLGQHLGHGRFAGLRTPRWQRRLEALLAARADTQGRITMRVEIVYGHALRGQPRPGADGTTVIALESLRHSLTQRRRPPDTP